MARGPAAMRLHKCISRLASACGRRCICVPRSPPRKGRAITTRNLATSIGSCSPRPTKDATVAPSPAAILIVKKQLGECNRQMGDYKEAIAMFTAVLQAKEAELSVQRSAALAYQGWGETDNPKWFENAIQGSDKNRTTGKNRIWGWLRLAIVAERTSRTNPQYRDLFYEVAARIGPLPVPGGARKPMATRRSNSSTSRSKAFARCCRSIQIWAVRNGATSLTNLVNFDSKSSRRRTAGTQRICGG